MKLFEGLILRNKVDKRLITLVEKIGDGMWRDSKGGNYTRNFLLENFEYDNELQFSKLEVLISKMIIAATNGRSFILIIENDKNPAPEEIKNPPENLRGKIDYIKEAYNEDLVLKSADFIRIKDGFEIIPGVPFQGNSGIGDIMKC